jgi:hypothetical protein
MDPWTAADRTAYSRALDDVAAMAVPRMFSSVNPHSRLYVAHFDGTGNHLGTDPEHLTNVGLMYLKLHQLSTREGRIASGYVPGPGTEGGAITRVVDSATGGSYDERLERMYHSFAGQVKQWINEDPEADIRLSVVGFSRGAEQAVAFARMVNERGVENPDGRAVAHRRFGDGSVHWTRPALRAPGRIPTSEILFDPVGTGAPHRYDRQPPGSSVSGLQISARDERRDAFPSSQIIPPGRSADGRFVGVTVPGAHSDIGGSYHRNGLSTLNFNIAADFINASSDIPLVARQPEPLDPDLYVIHHSDDHMWFYRTSEFRHDGYRDIMGAQASPPHCRQVITCAPPDPLDPVLAARMGPRFPVETGPAPGEWDAVHERFVETPRHDRNLDHDALLRYLVDEKVRGRPFNESMFWKDPATDLHRGPAVTTPTSFLASTWPKESNHHDEQSIYRPDDLRHPGHLDHAMYHSASMQLQELHVRSGFHLEPDQLDRLTAALVIEAKRHGITTITDLEFGDDPPGKPTLHAMQAFQGNLDDARTRRAAIDALETLAVPMDVANEQLRVVNRERDARVERQQAMRMQEQQYQGFTRQGKACRCESGAITPY